MSSAMSTKDDPARAKTIALPYIIVDVVMLSQCSDRAEVEEPLPLAA